MSAPPFNPYAPPAPDLVAAAPSSPLPVGFRRFRIDPVAYRALVRRALPRTFAVTVLIVGGVGTTMALALGGGNGPLTVGTTMIAVVVMLGFSFVRAGAANPVVLTHELVVGPRVLRRTAAGALPAEFLRPEVTRIVETSEGLFLTSTTPSRGLFVWRALDGYADVRAEIAQWATIETMAGWSAWRHAVKCGSLQGQRDAVLGTSLATDTSLREELEVARLVSSTAYASYPLGGARRGFPKKVLILWVVLIVMFLAIWQFLSPIPQAPRRPRPVDPSTQE